jgi:type IV pilus assembly protein PilE
MKGSGVAISAYFRAFARGFAENHSAVESDRPSAGRCRHGRRALWLSLEEWREEETAMQTTRQRGFTLIELMITVAIVGILAAIAYPSYTSYVRKGVRRAAQAQMMDIANREQQFFLSNRVYVPYSDATPSITASGYSLPTELTGKYTPTIATSTTTFTITFTAAGTQLIDGDLTLSSEGVKMPVDKW